MHSFKRRQFLTWIRKAGVPLTVAGALAGCSSSGEPKRAEVAVPAPQSQSAYTDYAADQLGYYRNRARQVPEAERSRFAAAVRDAQVTLDQLKRSNGDVWRSYRTRMEDSLQNLERVNRQARLDH